MAAGQSNPYTPSQYPDPNAPNQGNPGSNPPTPPNQQQQSQSSDGGSAQNPTPAWLRKHAREANWSEDFARFSDAQLQKWINSGLWDPNQQMFRTEKKDRQGNKIEGFVEKPPDVPEGWTAWGDQGQAIRMSDLNAQNQAAAGGAGGAAGGGAGGWGDGYPNFTAPTFEEALQDPGYQFSLQQGVNALENSAAAKGTLRTGGTLSDIIQYGQDAAANRYSDVYNRALQGFGANFQGWQTKYNQDFNRWQTKYNADLSKWMTRENNIANALNTPPPSAPTSA